MPVAHDLFYLIHSLSSNEKRYFKLFCDMQQGEKQYLKLFDYLDKMSAYDEEKIIQRFVAEDFVRNIHVTRNYLYNLVLKCLRTYHADKTVLSQLANLWIDVDLLEKRGLYDQARERLSKAEKLAIKFNDHLSLFRIYERQLHYLAEHNVKKIEADLTRIVEHINRQFEAVQHEKIVVQNYFRLSILQRVYNRHSNEFHNKISQIESLDTISSSSVTFRARYLLHYIKALRFRIEGDHHASQSCLMQTLAVWEQEPYMIKENNQVYRIHLSNFLSSCHHTQNYSHFISRLEELKALPTANFNEAAESFQNIIFQELTYRLNTLDLDLDHNWLAKVEKGLILYKAKINKAREKALYYNLCVLFFLKEDYNTALDWLNHILHDHKNEHRMDIQRFANILQLLLHLGLGNSELLTSLHSAVYRKLKRWATLSDFERCIFDFVKQWLGLINQREAKSLYQSFSDTLVQLRSELASNLPVGMEELVIWTERQCREPLK